MHPSISHIVINHVSISTRPDFNNTSSDEEEIDNNPSTHKISLTTPSSLHDSKSLSLPPLTSTTDILGNISSSDDSSSESEDSSGEEEEEEGEINDEVEKSTEENTRFILEQVNSLERLLYKGASFICPFM